MEQNVRVDLFHLVIAGLPFSGKTSLVDTLFDPPKSVSIEVCDLYEAIIHRSKMTGDSFWFEGSKLQANVHSILTAFAHFFAKEHKLPNLDLKNLKIAGTFDDPEIQRYFETTCDCLRQLVLNIDDENKVERMLSGSMTMVNVFDIGVNKAVYEFLMACGGHNKNLILVNVFDLLHSDEETLKKSLDLSDPRYGGKYRDNQMSVYKDRSALHHLMSRMQSASLSAPLSEPPHAPVRNTLLVGTHADKFRSKSELGDRKKEVAGMLKRYSADMGYPSKPGLPDMVTVNATDKDDCRKVETALLKLIDDNKHFSIDLPVRFIFLRYVLYCTKKIYMSRKEVIEYAKKCCIEEESDVDAFLEIFRNCASIISCANPKEYLYSYVILLPIEFLRELDRLYCIQDDRNIPADLKKPAQYGMLSASVLKALWQGSDQHLVLTCDFFINVLQNVQLILELADGRFFCPSLRLKHDDQPLHASSLIISSSLPFASFSGKQCTFVEYLTNTHKDDGLFKLDEECEYYNCVAFFSKSGKSEASVTIRLFHDFVEVFVDPLTSYKSKSHITKLYSILKTDCVAIMNQISEAKKSQYQFSFICPKSSMISGDCHFVPFDILDTSGDKLRCASCDLKISQAEGMQWVKAAYQGPPRAAVQAKGII